MARRTAGCCHGGNGAEDKRCEEEVLLVTRDDEDG